MSMPPPLPKQSSVATTTTPEQSGPPPLPPAPQPEPPQEVRLTVPPPLAAQQSVAISTTSSTTSSSKPPPLLNIPAPPQPKAQPPPLNIPKTHNETTRELTTPQHQKNKNNNTTSNVGVSNKIAIFQQPAPPSLPTTATTTSTTFKPAHPITNTTATTATATTTTTKPKTSTLPPPCPYIEWLKQLYVHISKYKYTLDLILDFIVAKFSQVLPPVCFDIIFTGVDSWITVTDEFISRIGAIISKRKYTTIPKTLADCQRGAQSKPPTHDDLFIEIVHLWEDAILPAMKRLVPFVCQNFISAIGWSSVKHDESTLHVLKTLRLLFDELYKQNYDGMNERVYYIDLTDFYSILFLPYNHFQSYYMFFNSLLSINERLTQGTYAPPHQQYAQVYDYSKYKQNLQFINFQTKLRDLQNQQLTEIKRYFNTFYNTTQTTAKLYEKVELLSLPYSFLQPNRCFIYQSTAGKLSTSTIQLSNQQIIQTYGEIFLFNDVFVFAEPMYVGGYKVHYEIPLSQDFLFTFSGVDKSVVEQSIFKFKAMNEVNNINIQEVYYKHSISHENNLKEAGQDSSPQQTNRSTGMTMQQLLSFPAYTTFEKQSIQDDLNQYQAQQLKINLNTIKQQHVKRQANIDDIDMRKEFHFPKTQSTGNLQHSASSLSHNDDLLRSTSMLSQSGADFSSDLNNTDSSGAPIVMTGAPPARPPSRPNRPTIVSPPSGFKAPNGPGSASHRPAPLPRSGSQIDLSQTTPGSATNNGFPVTSVQIQQEMINNLIASQFSPTEKQVQTVHQQQHDTSRIDANIYSQDKYKLDQDAPIYVTTNAIPDRDGGIDFGSDQTTRNIVLTSQSKAKVKTATIYNSPHSPYHLKITYAPDDIVVTFVIPDLTQLLLWMSFLTEIKHASVQVKKIKETALAQKLLAGINSGTTVQYKDFDYCMYCHNNFNFIYPKRHCKLCGNSCCRRCSIKFSAGEHKVRLCNECKP